MAHHYKFICLLFCHVEHFMSSLWMDVIDLIFQLLHIFNLPSLVILTPLRSPYTPSVDYVHFFVDYDNTSINYTDFLTNRGNTYVDYSNTLED
jgi:hypothetical protein